MTGQPFYSRARDFLLPRLHEFLLPDLFIYLDIDQPTLDSRYPKGYSSIFTNPTYNDYFKEHYYLEKRNKEIIKQSVENDKNHRKELLDYILSNCSTQ